MESETGRKSKSYSLTAAGRAQLEKEADNWNRLSAAINLVVQTFACHTFNESGVEIAVFDGNHTYYEEWAEKLA